MPTVKPSAGSPACLDHPHSASGREPAWCFWMPATGPISRMR